MNQATGPPSILIVDDDQPLCNVLTEILGDAGYGARRAYDGEAGWVEIKTRAPTLSLATSPCRVSMG
jgi:DNA-binding response OmpR family regulator